MTIAKVAAAVFFIGTVLGLVAEPARAFSLAELLIFEALAVPTSRVGNTHVDQKSIGGLVCERYEGRGSASATCSLGDVGRDDDAIYNALNVPAIDVTEADRRDYVVYEKSIGGLVCTRAHAVGLNPVRPYARCTLN